MTTTTAASDPLEPWAGEETLALQVLGILHEVLARPGMPEESKDRLRHLIGARGDHPEQILLEHLRCIRSSKAS